MKRFALVVIVLLGALFATAAPASARYFYRRPVARTAARVVLPPYRVVGPRFYGPRFYGPRVYGPGWYGGYYGPGWYGYGPGAYIGVGVY